MIQIKLDDTDEVVFAKITMLHLGSWKFTYLESPTEINKKKNTDYEPQPYSIALSSAEKLIGTTQLWRFDLFNESHQDLDYIVKIDWYQGANLKKTWFPKNPKGTIKQDAPPVILEGTCQFIKA